MRRKNKMTKTKIIFTILFILMFWPFLNAQNTLDSLNTSLTNNQDFIDYLKIRDETMLTSCSLADTFSVNMTLNNLLSIDTLKITTRSRDSELVLSYFSEYVLDKILNRKFNYFNLPIERLLSPKTDEEKTILNSFISQGQPIDSKPE